MLMTGSGTGTRIQTPWWQSNRLTFQQGAEVQRRSAHPTTEAEVPTGHELDADQGQAAPNIEQRLQPDMYLIGRGDMVYVLPLPVCPYAKQDALPFLNSVWTRGRTVVSYTWQSKSSAIPMQGLEESTGAAALRRSFTGNTRLSRRCIMSHQPARFACPRGHATPTARCKVQPICLSRVACCPIPILLLQLQAR